MSENRMTLAKPAQASIEERRSVFIANASPVSDTHEAAKFVESIRKKYHDARHNVFAYVTPVGAKYSDDGEPQGTAGVPVMNVLKMSCIDSAVIVVTRYFGGILLGAGGLVRAYCAAAKASIDAAGLCAIRAYAFCRILCSYSEYQKISASMSKIGACEENAEFSDGVIITAAIEKGREKELEQLVSELTIGRASFEIVAYADKASAD